MGLKVMHAGGDDVSDRWEVVLFDEPGYIHALPMAPDALESELQSGLWLVVVFPVYSISVRHSVVAALVCAKDFNGQFQLGVRPYHAREEITRWWPNDALAFDPGPLLTVVRESGRVEVHIGADDSIAPIWLVLQNGIPIHQAAGPRTMNQLTEIMQTALRGLG
jgi:hypothetical protein